ncbi:hypothetical protein FC39_GL000695 [Lactobacillus hamsteri DSM 5661 = JCM 6256]|uniref:Uncharacterized protein n=2 Tax=Lactobacillus hamsteri TaxID=96565 RepID=A0A0R1YM80_9LACO|nr:hypothetical protein FC39_GL000695 [Lactobacillus hamsteri DSM 5661 = JCM 6256]
MIIKDHKRFTWQNALITVAEIVVFIAATWWMLGEGLFDNPDLTDQNRISSSVKYEPLIMNTGTGNSNYVRIKAAAKKNGSQTYTYYSAGTKTTVSGDYASVVYGDKVNTVNAAKIPYEKKTLAKMDRQYQRAYVAIYTAEYKKNWQNGIGLHAGRIATRYYLIRIPDSSFIKNEK